MEHKHLNRLIDVFDAVTDDHDATLGIVGDGPEKIQLERQRNQLTHPDRVEFLGFLDDYEDVLGQMRAADVFASPSTREGFGLTFVEAMAADCTVIAADHSDSAADEVIGNAGFLVEPNLKSLHDALTRALDGDRPEGDPRERAQRYDWDAVAAQAEQAYRRAVDGSW